MGPHGDHGRWWNNPKLIEKLKLTDEQRKAMDDILQQHREKLIDLRAAVDKAELEMEPMVRADQPNESAVLAQIDKVAQARAELEKANARFLFALRAKLTPDQWKQVQDFRNNLGGHEGMRHDRSPGDRRPGGGDRHAASSSSSGPAGNVARRSRYAGGCRRESIAGRQEIKCKQRANAVVVQTGGGKR